MKKFYNNIYKKKGNMPITIFLILYGLGYFILSGDVMEWLGEVGLAICGSTFLILFIIHSILVIKNWNIIIYGRND